MLTPFLLPGPASLPWAPCSARGTTSCFTPFLFPTRRPTTFFSFKSRISTDSFSTHPAQKAVGCCHLVIQICSLCSRHPSIIFPHSTCAQRSQRKITSILLRDLLSFPLWTLILTDPRAPPLLRTCALQTPLLDSLHLLSSLKQCSKELATPSLSSPSMHHLLLPRSRLHNFLCNHK